MTCIAQIQDITKSEFSENVSKKIFFTIEKINKV